MPGMQISCKLTKPKQLTESVSEERRSSKEKSMWQQPGPLSLAFIQLSNVYKEEISPHPHLSFVLLDKSEAARPDAVKGNSLFTRPLCFYLQGEPYSCHKGRDDALFLPWAGFSSTWALRTSVLPPIFRSTPCTEQGWLLQSSPMCKKHLQIRLHFKGGDDPV